MLALAAVGIVYAFQSSKDEPPVFRDVAVEAVYPAAGSTVLRQERIGIDLAPGYTATLRVAGTDIPDDELQRFEGLNQVFFTPGPGTATGALSPGSVCAEATYQRVANAEEKPRTTRWCFTVH